MRLRPGLAVGRAADLQRAINAVDALLVRTHEDVRLGTALRWVLQAVAEVEGSIVGAPAAVEGLLDATAGWGMAVARAIQSALEYRSPQQRRTAMELAAEESAMRLIMAVEPARIEASQSLARAPQDDEVRRLRQSVLELATRVDVADRMLHARVMIAAVR